MNRKKITRSAGSFLLYNDQKPLEFFCYEDERGCLDVFFGSRSRIDSKFIGWASSEAWAKQLAIDWHENHYGVSLASKPMRLEQMPA
jgi:hypothetical protein